MIGQHTRSRTLTTWLVCAALALFNTLPPGALSPDLFVTQGHGPAATLHERGAEPMVVPRELPRVIGNKASVRQDAEGSQPAGDEPVALAVQAAADPTFRPQPVAPAVTAVAIRPLQPRVFDPRAPPIPAS